MRYLAYNAAIGIYVCSGKVVLPLPWRGRYFDEANKVDHKVCSILEAADARTILTVEWNGITSGGKPEPPLATFLGDFHLLHAYARVEAVAWGVSPMSIDFLAASGYLIFSTTARPEKMQLPAIWSPHDPRSRNPVNLVLQYVYTPAELGFKEWLPGAPVTPTTVPSQPGSLKDKIPNIPAGTPARKIGMQTRGVLVSMV